jgi:hypothetical protein
MRSDAARSSWLHARLNCQIGYFRDCGARSAVMSSVASAACPERVLATSSTPALAELTSLLLWWMCVLSGLVLCHRLRVQGSVRNIRPRRFATAPAPVSTTRQQPGLALRANSFVEFLNTTRCVLAQAPVLVLHSSWAIADETGHAPRHHCAPPLVVLEHNAAHLGHNTAATWLLEPLPTSAAKRTSRVYRLLTRCGVRAGRAAHRAWRRHSGR